MSILEAGILQLALFHGTSSLHLTSIREHGLGGVDPVGDLNVVPFLQELYSLGDQTLPADNEQWMMLRVVLEPMINQRVTACGFNFRHGRTYLTPSKLTAIKYAVNNPQGSECFSSAKVVYDLVRSVTPDRVNEIGARYPTLVKRINETGTPIVIGISGVPMTMLKSENGQPIDEVIRQIERFDSDKMADVLCQQFNFELQGVVPFASVSCYNVALTENAGYSLIDFEKSVG